MNRWYEISLDPNSPELLQQRRVALTKLRTQSLINDRIEYLCELARDKRVLDVGVVEHTVEASDDPRWLHGRLTKAARCCVGVDILAEGVDALQLRGFDVRLIDVTAESLEETFDLIVFGEIIEHVDAPGRIFANARKMLARGGSVVFTTPNPWFINAMAKNVLTNTPQFTDSADHVAWFDPSTMYELGQRHGLALTEFRGIRVRPSRRARLRARLLYGSLPLWSRLGIKPELFAKTLVYRFVALDEYDDKAA